MKNPGLLSALLLGSAVVGAREFSARPEFEPLDFDAVMRGPSLMDTLFQPVPVVTGRRGVVHVPVPNPRAEARKRRAVAEMQARKRAKRERGKS